MEPLDSRWQKYKTLTHHTRTESQTLKPINGDHETQFEDVQRSKKFGPIVEAGYANNMVEAAIRFSISKAEISTALVGVSSLEQFEQAVAYANKGPLSTDAISRLHDIWAGVAQ